MRKYNSRFENILGKKICYYCGKELHKSEDRDGCDYRESGEFYYSCSCPASYDEEKFEQEKREIIMSHKQAKYWALEGLKMNYRDKLNKLPSIDELKYELELQKLNKKFGK